MKSTRRDTTVQLDRGHIIVQAAKRDRGRLYVSSIGSRDIQPGAGAYAAGMSAKNYNAFPEAAEVLIDRDGEPRLVRERQTLDQALANEV